jgi:hypothetical protein
MIIGLTGFAGSGKSEVARFLREDAGFRRVAFADPLKSMLSAVGFTHEQLYGDQKMVPMPEFGGKTPRHLMQTLGTEWGRRLVDPEIWITLWKRQAEAVMSRRDLVVADDVRFPNEVEAITALGGEVWRIRRPGVSVMSHESEAHIAYLRCSEVIDNAYDLHTLRTSAGWALARAMARAGK